MTSGELILYTTEDGTTQLHLRAEQGTVWLMQAEIATLFQTTKQNVSLHAKNVLADGELIAEAVVKERLTTASDGKNYRTLLYNLDMILAIGYRVRSGRGTQFRRWATSHLREFLVKGFVMDDARLKDPTGWDYFDELLERIREIRASEKRFYQKVRDIYATAVDYDGTSDAAKLFFSKVMLWAITGRTAAELITQRADAAQPNMGLQTWKGARVRRGDVTVAKNYLGDEEMTELDRVVVMYLDYAEDQAKRRKITTMQDWADKLDAFLAFNDRDVLKHAGQVSAQVAETLALERYADFDAQRRLADLRTADAEDAQALEQLGVAVERANPAKKRSQD